MVAICKGLYEGIAHTELGTGTHTGLKVQIAVGRGMYAGINAATTCQHGLY